MAQNPVCCSSFTRRCNGCLCAGELVGLEDSTELSQEEAEEATDKVEWSQDAAAAGFVDLLIELGADKLLEK